MRRRILLETLVIVLVGILVTFLIRGHSGPPSADIMTGSSYITNIIQDLSDGGVKTRTIIPPGVCPGHYDVKPSEIKALANSKALFIHNYQQTYQNIAGAVEAAQNPDLIITVLNVTGNWMVPAVQAEAVSKIAQALGEIYPENAAYYQGNASERIQAILAYGEQVKNRLQDAGVDGAKVICAAMQEGFVRWAGFNVTATYGRPEELGSPADVEQLLTEAIEAGVVLVIDNLQSGTTTLGASLGHDIEAIPITISNFPGGLENTETWEKAIDENVYLLLEAWNEWEEQYG
jgi:zinc transport system substrate-binding protein